MTNEVWLPVNGYELTHIVSNLGRVKSLSRKWTSGKYNSIRFSEEKLLTPIKQSCGYLRVNIHSNGIRRFIPIHRLVAITFIPNPEHKPEVNHKDGNKHNNTVENLEWCTRSENNQHSYDNGLNGAHKRKTKNYFGKY